MDKCISTAGMVNINYDLPYYNNQVEDMARPKIDTSVAVISIDDCLRKVTSPTAEEVIERITEVIKGC